MVGVIITVITVITVSTHNYYGSRQFLKLSHGTYSKSIDLVTVLEAILMSRQPHEKLQCLYENVMLNNFHKIAVLRKI